MKLNYVQQELRRRREAAGLSQRKLSLLVGDNDSLVKKIENGLSKNPRIDTLKALAEALNCKVSDLTGDPDGSNFGNEEAQEKKVASAQKVIDLRDDDTIPPHLKNNHLTDEEIAWLDRFRGLTDEHRATIMTLTDQLRGAEAKKASGE